MSNSQADRLAEPPACNADFGDPRKPMDETELQEFCIALSFRQDDYTVEVIRAVEDRMMAKPLFVASAANQNELQRAHTILAEAGIKEKTNG